jgi:hypothetical protein
MGAAMDRFTMSRNVRIPPHVSERAMKEIGARLREMYSDPPETPLPRLLSDLLNALEQRTSTSTSVLTDRAGGEN